MTRILVIGHSGLAAALVRVAREIVGPDAPCAAFDLFLEQTLESIKIDLRRWLDDQLERGPVVLLTDLPGATPHNLAVTLAEEQEIDVVTGVNLPMLLRTLNHADAEPARLAELAVEGGIRAIRRSSDDTPPESSGSGSQ